MNSLSKTLFSIILATVMIVCQSCDNTPPRQPGWPEITSETKPWTRWWWHGNAATKDGITAEMEAYKKAGIGGLEITPIYGVHGYEDRFINYLSPQWMELLMHTLKEGERLGMGIDMATGTGWPFGGPWIGAEDACKNMYHKVYELKGGETLKELVHCVQQPYLRAVGSQIYEVHDNPVAGSEPRGSRKEPLMEASGKQIRIEDLVDPIANNKNLQALAIDQVQFEKPIPLQTLMAYNESGEVLDLTGKVDAGGKLNWVAPGGNWKLYAVFQGWHGKMVERAGPGGEGNVIDHFSADALARYFTRFDSAFRTHDIKSLRSFFNDSYEVDDARGAADWTPELLNEFAKRRGYDLRHHLPALLGHDTEEKNQRVLSDYRETISELLLTNFTQPWKAWAHKHSALVRNQAHGSPANILDLYATVDIPEIEGVEPLRIRMASSAGNVTGKKLVSSESATWLNEHFESNLSDIKTALDRFMLNGVNHIFYHGTAYSPPGEPWPGWLFYAAVHLNPRNSLWNDFDALNQYVARCQSFLQRTTPDNDVLLYYPVYDRFAVHSQEMIEHFDGIGRQFAGTTFAYAAEKMLAKGYAFDFISDAQIEKTIFRDGALVTEGNSAYTTLVIPHCRFIPVATLKKIVALAEDGATIIMLQGAPDAAAGYADLENKKRSFDALITQFHEGPKVLEGDSIDVLLQQAGTRRETMTDAGIGFIRKKDENGTTVYMISNSKDVPFEGWLPLHVSAGTVILYDAMTGEYGKARARSGSNATAEVYVQLTPRQTLIVEAQQKPVTADDFPYYQTSGPAVALKGPWKVTFAAGGPALPPAVTADTLASWTTYGKPYEPFSGTAVYTLSFGKPEAQAEAWLLDLGVVKESAEVILNGRSLGKLIGPAYRVRIDASLLEADNQLEVRVSNLMANRIADMDKRNVFWKKFYNVNFPARKVENRKHNIFDASGWLPRDSGLIGPVRLLPVVTGEQ